MTFASVVPAIRTVPGVEEFDYRLPDGHACEIGDIILVTFRKKTLPALIVKIGLTSPFADKALLLENPQILVRGGKALANLLTVSAQHAFASQPTVFDSWIRTLPKKLTPIDPSVRPEIKPTDTPVRENRLLLDRWNDPNGLITEATRRSDQRVLILAPWKHRADALAERLNCQAFHSDVADGAAWKAVSDFANGKTKTLIATRVGTWLAVFADAVLVDEPENDEFKQDELTPRLDARWTLGILVAIRPEISLIGFAHTPRLLGQQTAGEIPTLNPELVFDDRSTMFRSDIAGLTPHAMQAISEAVEQNIPVAILHAQQGLRNQLTCRDCGWSAKCESCGFVLSQLPTTALCRKCGRKWPIPLECGGCGGAELTRGMPGRDRLADLCKKQFPTGDVSVMSPLEGDALKLDRPHLLIVTDLSVLSGAVEDIRKKERLLIAWRRLCAAAERSQSRLIIQAPGELAEICPAWLTADGVRQTWATEWAERKSFHFPPAMPMAKLLIDGSEREAETVLEDLKKVLPTQAWDVRGPFPVEFRAASRTPRQVLHVLAPLGTMEADFQRVLRNFAKRAIIDLDPIAFFS